MLHIAVLPKVPTPAHNPLCPLSQPHFPMACATGSSRQLPLHLIDIPARTTQVKHLLTEANERRVKGSHVKAVLSTMIMNDNRAIPTAGGLARGLALACPGQMLPCPGLTGLLCLAAA